MVEWLIYIFFDCSFVNILFFFNSICLMWGGVGSVVVIMLYMVVSLCGVFGCGMFLGSFCFIFGFLLSKVDIVKFDLSSFFVIVELMFFKLMILILWVVLVEYVDWWVLWWLSKSCKVVLFIIF